MKGGRDAARLAHRTRYFATREGVQLLKDDNSSLPATKKQQQYIRRLLRSFPAASELPEHEDYVNMPSRQTAFDLIAQIHEDFIEPMDSRENYLDYVANRPGVKALGEHGLWDANGKVPSLENAVAEVAQHTGNVWTPVISLSRENAERLVPKDIDAAIRLLKDSAGHGNQYAQYMLGKLYLLGQEVKTNREEALRYLTQAAAQGNTYAQYFIDHQDDISGVAIGTAIIRMLHQMSRIFRENAAQPAVYAEMQIDKKRRRKLQEKRMAMGHKADDHEDRGLTQQTQ